MKNLILLSLLLTLFVSCNEEVSEELQASSDDEVVIDPVLQEMRLVSNMHEDLSYIMHQMGSLSTACSLTPPSTGLFAEDYTKADSIRNVDCVLDVEELDLNFHGADFEVQVDNKMCEYIQYQPYRYFKHQPGKTERIVFKTECDAACGAAMPESCGVYYDTIDTNPVTFGTYSSSSFVTDVTAGFNDQSMCSFNYNVDTDDEDDVEALCDNGQVTAEAYYVSGYYAETCSSSTYTNQVDCEAADETWEGATYCNGAGEPTGTVTYSRLESSDEENECGGELHSCLAGAGIEGGQDVEPFTLTYSEELDYTQQFTVEAPNDLEEEAARVRNIHVANFSRVCSDTSTNKIAPSIYDTLEYNGAENEVIGDIFTPTEVDTNGDNINDSIVYADHPFAGYDGNSTVKNSVSPYYAIRCLDRAGDIKAQIRLHIREWDREFDDDNIYLARVSDKSNEATGISRMDNNGIYDGDIKWNDYGDWDNFFDDGVNYIFVDNMCSNLTNDALSIGHGAGNFPGY